MWLTTLVFYLFIFLSTVHLIRKHLRNGKTAKLKHASFYSIGGEFFALKKWLMYCLLSLRAWRQRRRPLLVWDREQLKAWEESEKPQPLDQNDKHSIDSVYFYGGELEANKPAFIVRLARRPDRVAELWFLVRLPDGTVLEHPVQPNTHVANCHPDTWSAGGFSVTCEEPMTFWSLRYHGLMKRSTGVKLEAQPTVSHSPDDYITVSLRARFRAAVNPFDSKTDLSSKITAEFLAREPWSSAFFAKLKHNEEQVHLEQWGALTGEMTVGDERYDLNMGAYRDHSYGVRNWRQYYRYAAHFGYLENGSFFSFGSVSIPQTTTHVKYGYIYLPYGKKCAIDWHDFNLWEKGEITEPPKSYQVRFIANGKDYKVEVRAEDNIPLYVQSASNVLYERFTEFTVNGIRGWGVTEYCYWHHNALPGAPEDSLALPAVPELQEKDGNAKKLLVVDLDQPECRARSLSGGKGSQLAVATAIFNGGSAGSVRVPKGYAVTTESYREFIRANPALKQGIKALRLAATAGGGAASLEAACKVLTQAFGSAILPESVTNALVASSERVFGSSGTLRLAVRSSGVSEDGSSASSAGQMETFLGVNPKELPAKLIDCWASLFAHRAVQYRQSGGLGVDASMAVVVQEMVPATAAGVLFSQDPISGNSSLMKIEANFGLGESVVSGLVTPDTFTVRRFPDGFKTIEERRLGEKSEVMQVGESGLETRHSDQQSSSLNDQLVLDLADLGEQLEKRYGAPVDIEFAVSGDAILLLQVRPVTAIGPEIPDDLLHEFDSAYSFKEGWVTTANIGEMSPGAMTPLTLSTFGRSVDWSICKYKAVRSGVLKEINRPLSGLGCSANHLVINLMELGLSSEVMSILGKFDMACIALLGRTLDEPTRDDLRRYMDGEANLLDKVWNAAVDMATIFQSASLTRAWEKKFMDGYHVLPQYTAKEQYRAIDERLPDYAKCWCDTIINTSKSALNSMILVNIFSEQFGLNEQTYSKLAMCLANCDNVYSADVPTAMHNLAVDLSSSPDCQAFLAMTPEKAAEWLLSHESGSAGESFRSFINRHGFRCIKEAEFRELSWRSAPEKVVSVMQATIAAGSVRRQAKEVLSIDEVVERLSLRGHVTKRIVKALIPLARNGVASREWGKAISIRMVDALKEGYKRLGQLLVREELLPDADLVYFLTHRELGILVERKDTPSLVKKALRRRTILPVQNSLQLPELIKGNPRFGPLAQQERPQTQRFSSDGLNSVSGMPVSRGVVSGVARVVCSLLDAAQIQKGDILVVPYTDVGWTPYFPLISGLVTEKGGLLSHGAVVAREFGIPCVVGAKQVTTLFKTGDLITLDGDRGQVQVTRQATELS